MKFAVLILAVCFSYCVGYQLTKPTTWGNTYARVMGSEHVVIESSMFQVKKHSFVFPKIVSPFPIVGIKHFDYKSHPVKVFIVKGGIGSTNVTINIESQRGHGINSTFIFYAQ